MVMWWKDGSRLPPGSSPGARPVWIMGQWCFIPFAFGHVPLSRRCSTAGEAESEALCYEEKLASLIPSGLGANRSSDVREELGALPRWDNGEDPGLTKGCAIYYAGEPGIDDECFLLMPDGQLKHDVFRSYDEAITAAAQMSATQLGPRRA